jgi:hypothetical protein
MTRVVPFFLSFLVPVALALTTIPRWWEQRLRVNTGELGEVYLWYHGYGEVYGWVVIGCVAAYAAIAFIGRRYPVLSATVLSLAALASVLAARQHYSDLGGETAETLTPLDVALVFAALWVVQSVAVLVFWRGERFSGLAAAVAAVEAFGGRFAGFRVSGPELGSVLDFRKMLAPWLIRLLFVLGSIFILVGGLGLAIDGLTRADSSDFWRGIGVAVFGPILVRLLCEYAILFFRMNETLNELNASLHRSDSRPDDAVLGSHPHP